MMFIYLPLFDRWHRVERNKIIYCQSHLMRYGARVPVVINFYVGSQ